MSDLADLAQLIRARRPIAGIRQYRNADLESARKSTAVDDLLAAIKAQEAQTYGRLKDLPDERVNLEPAYASLLRAGQLARETGLAPGMARSEEFTPPTRTVTQELGKRAREMGGTGLMAGLIPGIGAYTTPASAALLALGALQELVHPYREEGESRLWGAAELAGSALPYAKYARIVLPETRAARATRMGEELQRQTAAWEAAVPETVRHAPGNVSQGLEQYLAGVETPASGTSALEGLRRAGALARGTRAAHAAELHVARTSLPPEFAAVGEEPFFQSARRTAQSEEQAARTGIAEAAQERYRTQRSIEAAKARAAGTLPPDLGQAKMAGQVNAAIRAARAARTATPSLRLDKYTRTLNTLAQEAEETAPGEVNPLRSEFGEQRALPTDPRDLLGRYALARLLRLKTVLGTTER